MIETDLFDPGEPHEHLDDTIDIEWVDKRQAVAGLLRVSVRPSAGATWFLAVVHEQGEDPVVVLDYELPLVSHAFEFRAPGIWTDFVCETPIEQWTIGLEAFGIAVDPDDVIHPATFGDRTPVGLDLDVEAASAPDEHDDGFEHEVTKGVFEAVKVTTRAACERISRLAYDHARRRGRSKVTIVHKCSFGAS